MNYNSVSSIILNSKQTVPRSQRIYMQTGSDSFVLALDLHNRYIRKYTIPKQNYISDSFFYQWRKTVQKPLPKIIVNQNHQINQQVIIYSDHIAASLTQTQSMSIVKSIEYLKQMMLAYQQIFSKFGFACVEPQFVGTDKQGNVIVWISKNLCSNIGESIRLKTQFQIIARTISIIYQKCNQKNNIFFQKINFVEPKFASIKAFISSFSFDQKEKTSCVITNSIIERKNILKNYQIASQIAKNQKIFMQKSCQHKNNNQITQNKQKLPSNIYFTKDNSNIYIAEDNSNIYIAEDNKSIIKNSRMMSPNNQSQIIESKSNIKINFSYSQKRNQNLTPKDKKIPRQYTSQNTFGLICKINQPNIIQQFTLQAKNFNISKQSHRTNTQKTRNFKIVRQYSLYYLPSVNLFIIKQRQELQRLNQSRLLKLSSNNKIGLSLNKASMTTNKASISTNPQTQKNSRIINGIMKQSSQSDQMISRTLNMTSSNNCCLNQNSRSHNFYSHIQDSSYKRNQRSIQKQVPNTYTFGGLITVQQEQEGKKSRKSSQQSSQNNVQKSLKRNNKSIEEIYNNLYFKEQEKSMIFEDNLNQNQLHRTYNNKYQVGPLNGTNSNFNMDAWRNIKGLLNQSRTDLKQSIHCGPQIRTPVNIKLQMLGKFGRDIGQSIIPNPY